MTTFSFHPVDLGDLPPRLKLRDWGTLLPLDLDGIGKNWAERYSAFISREECGEARALWIDVKAADRWLDERGRALFSEIALVEKRRRNPGWTPARDRLDAVLAGLQGKILREIAALIDNARTTTTPQGNALEVMP